MIEYILLFILIVCVCGLLWAVIVGAILYANFIIERGKEK